MADILSNAEARDKGISINRRQFIGLLVIAGVSLTAVSNPDIRASTWKAITQLIPPVPAAEPVTDIKGISVAPIEPVVEPADFLETTGDSTKIAVELNSLWDQKEAETIGQEISEDLRLLGSTFGPGNKKINQIDVVPLTDELRSAWHWDKSFTAAVRCVAQTDNNTTCTIYLDRKMDSPENQSQAKWKLKHELVHAWIGGTYHEGSDEFDDQGYIFAKLADLNSAPKSGGLIPAMLFNEENIADFFASYSQKSEAKLSTTNKILSEVLKNNPKFFQEMRSLDNQDMDKKTLLAELTKALANADSAALDSLYWK